MATFEELLNGIGSNPKVRAFGSFNDYQPDTLHKDVIYLATDEGRLYLNGQAYGGDSGEIPIIWIKGWSYSLKDATAPLFEGQLPFYTHFSIQEQQLDILKKAPAQVIFKADTALNEIMKADGTITAWPRPNPYLPNYLLGTLVQVTEGSPMITYRVQPLDNITPLSNSDVIGAAVSTNVLKVNPLEDPSMGDELIVVERDNRITSHIPYSPTGFISNINFYIDTTKVYSVGEQTAVGSDVIIEGVQGLTTMSWNSPWYADPSAKLGLTAYNTSIPIKYGVDIELLDSTVQEIFRLLQRRAVSEYMDGNSRYDLGGLGLSRNNFTDEYKEAITPLLSGGESQKVLSDNNFSNEDKAVVDNAKDFLESTDPDNTTINRWKELESFLAGITDTETLSGLLEAVQKAAEADAAAKVKVVQDELNTLKETFETFKDNVTILFNDLYRIVKPLEEVE